MGIVEKHVQGMRRQIGQIVHGKTLQRPGQNLRSAGGRRRKAVGGPFACSRRVRTLADEFSHKEQLILSHGDLSIAGEIERVRDDDDRVVLKLTRECNGNKATQSYELRPEAGAWRIFNLERARETSVVLDR